MILITDYYLSWLTFLICFLYIPSYSLKYRFALLCLVVFIVICASYICVSRHGNMKIHHICHLKSQISNKSTKERHYKTSCCCCPFQPSRDYRRPSQARSIASSGGDIMMPLPIEVMSCGCCAETPTADRRWR